MRSLILVLALSLMLASFACAQEEDYEETSRVSASLRISTPEGNKTVVLEEGDEFNVSAVARCMNASCGTVEIYLFHCTGQDCSEYTVIGADAYYPIYVWGESYHRCLMIGKGQTCMNTWKVRGKRPGLYSLVFIAQSTNTGSVYSDKVDVQVSGCGDGWCSGTEDHVSCSRDCCEADCTSELDDFCHRKCSGYQNCSISADCDGKPAGYMECLTDTSYISCCSVGVKICSHGEYCSAAVCLNCSYKCDGVCDSSACYRIDPDCDPEGNPKLGCCGNNVIDDGEECDGYMSFCRNGCDRVCRCNPVPTTTTLYVEPEPTTMPVSASTQPLTPTTSSSQASSTTQAGEQEKGGIGWLHLGLALVAVSLIVFIPKFLSQSKLHEDYDSLVAREEDLSAKRHKVYADFKLGVLSEDVASRMILGYDKELESVRKKIKKEAGKLIEK